MCRDLLQVAHQHLALLLPPTLLLPLGHLAVLQPRFSQPPSLPLPLGTSPKLPLHPLGQALPQVNCCIDCIAVHFQLAVTQSKLSPVKQSL